LAEAESLLIFNTKLGLTNRMGRGHLDKMLVTHIRNITLRLTFMEHEETSPFRTVCNLSPETDKTRPRWISLFVLFQFFLSPSNLCLPFQIQSP